jgi:hypothetical protein
MNGKCLLVRLTGKQHLELFLRWPCITSRSCSIWTCTTHSTPTHTNSKRKQTYNLHSHAPVLKIWPWTPISSTCRDHINQNPPPQEFASVGIWTWDLLLRSVLLGLWWPTGPRTVRNKIWNLESHHLFITDNVTQTLRMCLVQRSGGMGRFHPYFLVWDCPVSCLVERDGFILVLCLVRGMKKM